MCQDRYVTYATLQCKVALLLEFFFFFWCTVLTLDFCFNPSSFVCEDEAMDFITALLTSFDTTPPQKKFARCFLKNFFMRNVRIGGFSIHRTVPWQCWGPISRSGPSFGPNWGTDRHYKLHRYSLSPKDGSKITEVIASVLQLIRSVYLRTRATPALGVKC